MNARVSETKKTTVPFELGGVTYELAITLNVIEEIQRLKGDFSDAMTEALGDIGMLKELFLLIFNEAVEVWNEDHPEEKRQLFTAKSLGRRLTYGHIEQLQELLFTLVGASMPDAPETKGAEVTGEMGELLAGEAFEEEEKNADARSA